MKRSLMNTIQEKVPLPLPAYECPAHTLVYLGGATLLYGGKPKRYDFYYCGSQPVEPTVIARYGDEPGDYMSGLPFGWIPDDPEHPLVFARILAEGRGLDVR